VCVCVCVFIGVFLPGMLWSGRILPSPFECVANVLLMCC
jgi:hypothetical protein